ncbi:MAG: UDP-glucose/GDP-mannose dehydrogenase family protein [Vampirovibrionales bacterium]|nr:UDP-glucose/GDP-mannose dehydrogenase family protein [Vampirovibrionales bacterium]
MKLCVVGTGYVGLVTGTCLAEMGNDVTCVDIDAEKIRLLNSGIMPIYEPGLDELVRANTTEGRLSFTTDLATAVQESQACFIAVGTPQGEDGSADLNAVFAVGKAIGQAMTTKPTGYKAIVTKSTVPVGTAEKLQAIVAEQTTQPFSVVSNPEFLKQGDAVDDCLKPDRVIVGTVPNDQAAIDLMRELYSPYLRTGNPIIMMDIRSAEMTKYVANAFLATKISFINEMSQLCDGLGADIAQVQVGISTDRRIGGQFLYPGLGYGGSCFPKDVKALIRTADEHHCPASIIRSVDTVNQRQRSLFLDKIMHFFGGSVAGKTIAFWGLAFKPRTDDLREAPSVTLAEGLIASGARVQAFDPKAMEAARQHYLGETITYCASAYDAVKNADALVLVTEWNEFRRPDFEKVKALMKTPVLFDGRNQYDPDRMAERGFHYLSVGRPVLSPCNGNPAEVATVQPSEKTLAAV